MKINVYGVSHTIKEMTTKELAFYRNQVDSKYMGFYVPIESTIYINSELNHDTKRRTFIHELSHAILFVQGYGEEYNQENVVDILSAHHDYIENILNKWDKG